MRRRVLIAAAIVIIPVLLLLIAVLLMPAERIGNIVATRAETALKRDVSVGSIRIRIVPRPAVVLERVSIGGATPNSKLATARRIELHPKLLPLLRRRAVIDEIVLERPQMMVSIAADGTSNLPTLSKSENKGSDAELRVREIRLQDATLIYRDARTNTAVRLTGVNETLELSGPLTGNKPVNAAGQLSIDDIDANLPGQVAWPLRNVKLRVDHNLALDRTADRIDIEQLNVAVQEMELQLSGAMRGLKNPQQRSVDLRVATGNVDIEKLIASLPQALLKGTSSEALTGAAGFVKIDAKVSGPLAKGSQPRVAGIVKLADVALARGKHGKIVSNVTGDIRFSLDGISSKGIAGELLGEPLRVAFSVNDFSAPHGKVAIKTALALAEVEKLGFFPKGTSGTGHIAFDVNASGSLLEPADALLNGNVSLNGVQVQTAALKKPVIVQQARIALNGREAMAQQVRAKIGRSDVAIDFHAKEWLPYALGDSTRYPVVTFASQSNVFDVDEMFGVKEEKYRYSQLFFARLSNKTLDGKTAAQAAEEVGLGMPEVPPIQMDGKIRAAQFVRGGVRFDDVDVTIAARNGEMDVRGASFKLMGGDVQITGRLGLASNAAQALVLDYKANDLKAQQFIQRFTNFRDQISGTMLLGGSVQMSLDKQLLPVRESMNGAGTVAVLNGEIINWPLLKALGQKLGVSSFDTIAFKDWNGRYRIAGSKLIIEESEMDARQLSVRAAGSVDLDGTLDLGATLLLPQEHAARIPGASTAVLVKSASDSAGRVPVGAKIKGTARQPSIALDMSEAGKRSVQTARNAAEQEAKKAAASVADKIAQRVLPKDSTATDSTKSKVESLVGGGIKKLFKPRT